MRTYDDSGYKAIEEMQSAAQRDPLDVSDIPTPDDIAQGRTEHSRRIAAELLTAVRKHLAQSGVGGVLTTVQPLRGGPVLDGAVRVVNAALSSRGWRIAVQYEQREGTWCELVAVAGST